MNILRNGAAILAVIVLMALAAGCKKNYVNQMQDLEKKACACRDKACAELALKELKVISEDMDARKTTNSNDELQNMSQSFGNITKCIIQSGIAPQDVLRVGM